MFSLDLASKLGLHPVTLACLVPCTSSLYWYIKLPPLGPWNHHGTTMMAVHCNRLLQYAIYSYWTQFEMLQLSLASKLGLHPVTLAHLADISSSFPKWVPLRPMYGNQALHCNSLLVQYAIHGY
jgi:hypothetical protein